MAMIAQWEPSWIPLSPEILEMVCADAAKFDREAFAKTLESTEMPWHVKDVIANLMPDKMSPEQVEQAMLDARSEIYWACAGIKKAEIKKALGIEEDDSFEADYDWYISTNFELLSMVRKYTGPTDEESAVDSICISGETKQGVPLADAKAEDFTKIMARDQSVLDHLIEILWYEEKKKQANHICRDSSYLCNTCIPPMYQFMMNQRTDQIAAVVREAKTAKEVDSLDLESVD